MNELQQLQALTACITHDPCMRDLPTIVRYGTLKHTLTHAHAHSRIHPPMTDRPFEDRVLPE